MSMETLEKLVQETMSYTEGGPAAFCWQGGEPTLMGVEFFQQAVEFQKKYGKPGQIVSNSLQTNGILLNEKWSPLLKKYKFFVGISLDGPSDIHNYYRKFSSGKGSFKNVMQTINLMRREQIEFNILSTIGKETAKDPKRLYQFFLSHHLYFLQFIPAVDRKHDKMSSFSINPRQYGDFLCGLFDVWWNNGQPFTSIRLFDNILEILMGQEANSCAFKKTCGEYLVIEFNGDIYPCDFFVGTEWKLGNIFENNFEDMFRKTHEQFGNMKTYTPEECKNCKWNFICHNGCLWFRWIQNGDFKGKDFLCDSYQRFFSYSMERLEKLSNALLGEFGLDTG